MTWVGKILLVEYCAIPKGFFMTGNDGRYPGENRAAELRSNFVEHLKQIGIITSSEVEKAAMSVPRHLLLNDVADCDKAYEDKTIILKRDDDGIVFGKGRTLSSSTLPGLVLSMVERLDVRSGMRVMDVGTGSGYTAAVLAEIVQDQKQVFSLEIDPEIAARAETMLENAGYGDINVIQGDAIHGYGPGAPYGRIMATVGCCDIPISWINQLADNGSMLVPLSFSKRGGSYPGVKFTKDGDHLRGEFLTRLSDMGFVPLYGQSDFEKLVYDATAFSLKEKVTAVLQRSSSIRGGDLFGVMLLATLQISEVCNRNPSCNLDEINPESFADETADRWLEIGRPYVTDFHCILGSQVDVPRSTAKWTFNKGQRKLVVYVEKRRS